MPAEVKAPPFPESVEEGTLSTWHKQPGDTVKRDEKVADVETDKIVLEVTAPQAGVLKDIAVEEGATVAAGQVLAHIADGEGQADTKKTDTTESPPTKTESTEKDKPEETASSDEEPAATEEEQPTDQADDKAEQSDKSADVVLSPAVRRLVKAHDLDPSAIKGSGRGGRITKSDVLAHLEQSGQPVDDDAGEQQEAPETKSSADADDEVEAVSESGQVSEDDADAAAEDGRPEKRVPLSRIRARIAERLVEAQQNAALLTTFNEVDMKPIMNLRARYKDDFEKTYGVKLGFMSFFVKASVAALKKYPVVNATLDGTDLVYHGYYDIGVAVSTDRGLVVPVLRNADQLTFAEIEEAIVEYAGRAREGQLSMDDLTGGTFTITNGGIFGSLCSTPIINPPQSGILGMHKIQERPVAVDGQVVIRPMMYTALTYDHRLIDGREAVQFLVEIKNVLEDPAKVLLDV